MRLLSAWISTNAYHFWNNKSAFLQIFHHPSVSWDITPLYFFSWNFIYFQQKKAIKVKISWYLTWAVKSLKYCTLMDSFCPNHITFQLKKVPKIYLSWHLRDVKFKEKLTCGLKFEMWFHIFMTWKTSWIFSQTLKILKISFWNCENINLKCALFVQSIWGLSYKNIEGLSFMALNIDAKFE